MDFFSKKPIFYSIQKSFLFQMFYENQNLKFTHDFYYNENLRNINININININTYTQDIMRKYLIFSYNKKNVKK